MNTKDDIIRILDPYNSFEIVSCDGDPQKILQNLFEIKEKWTFRELETYMSDFIDVDMNFDNFLIKFTRMIKEKNPFDESKDVNFYIRKF